MTTPKPTIRNFVRVVCSPSRHHQGSNAINSSLCCCYEMLYGWGGDSKTRRCMHAGMDCLSSEHLRSGMHDPEAALANMIGCQAVAEAADCFSRLLSGKAKTRSSPLARFLDSSSGDDDEAPAKVLLSHQLTFHAFHNPHTHALPVHVSSTGRARSLMRTLYMWGVLLRNQSGSNVFSY